MAWLLFSLLTALSKSFGDVLSKRVLLKQIDEYLVAFSVYFFSLCILLPLLFFIDIPAVNDMFWKAVIVSALLNSVASVLYLKALKNSDMSLVLPLLAFTPLFLLITSPLILGEFPQMLGLLGVLFIVVGSYMLNIKERRNGFWGPMKALWSDRGSKLMLAVAFIFSISSNFDKIYVRNSSAIFGWTIHAIIVMIILLPIALQRNRKNFFLIFTKAKTLMPLGIMEGLTGTLQMMAISMTLVPYVISVKRTSLVLGTVWGHLFFHEKNVKERFLSAVMMVIGVVLITLA